jgi:TldD protein
MTLRTGDHGALARAALAAARRWAGPDARGDAYLEEIRAVTWRRSDGTADPTRIHDDRGASVRVWAGDDLQMASADGPPGPAMVSCLRQMELPAVRGAEAVAVVDGLAAPSDLPQAAAAGPETDFLAGLERDLSRSLAGVRWELALEDRGRVTLVADDEDHLATGAFRWLRLQVRGGGDMGVAGWSGGAADLAALARAWPAEQLAGVMQRRLLGSRIPAAGRPRCDADTPVIFAAGNGALLLHELTHGLEADQVARGWSAWSEAGETVSPLVTLWDDPSRPGLRGTYETDDEGRRARRRLLIRQGRILGRLGDRRHSGSVAGAEDGHGRRSSRHHAPRPRSANLCMAAGDMPTAALSVVARPVLWVHDLEAGATDPRSAHVHLRVSDGEWLEDGRSLGPVSGISLEGWLPEILSGIDRVGTERRSDNGAATCGRDGEGVPVGFLTPAFRTRGLWESA